MEIARPMPLTPLHRRLDHAISQPAARVRMPLGQSLCRHQALRPPQPWPRACHARLAIAPFVLFFYYTCRQMGTIAWSGSLLHSRSISNRLFINLCTLTFA